ncbi:MAG: hypothetical protein PHY59_03010 [Methanobacterium sp.]|nr:hypothetical protein [Methanobacterium sp.]
MGILIAGTTTANATAKTKIDTHIGQDDSGGNFVAINKDKDWYIKKGTGATLRSWLLINDLSVSRNVHYYMYKLNADGTRGKQIFNDYVTSGHDMDVGSENLEYGDYKLCIIYWGSGDGDWPRSDKEVIIHVRDLRAGIYPYDPSGKVDINNPLCGVELDDSNLFRIYALAVAYNPKTQKYEILPNKSLHLKLLSYNRIKKGVIEENYHLSNNGPIYFSKSSENLCYYTLKIDFHTKYGTYVKNVYSIGNTI